MQLQRVCQLGVVIKHQLQDLINLDVKLWYFASNSEFDLIFQRSKQTRSFEQPVCFEYFGERTDNKIKKRKKKEKKKKQKKKKKKINVFFFFQAEDGIRDTNS
eukprot:TRINITY_DN39986_c0_g2_i2.p1 TRINITY_DN39986_c0_g2~~TRINITY_DN39986_c0_g2_i2.p1  ORF type:complete len:103 (+),score=17.83 TRINITY_DN39986_c0_g2_i2:203-511(+)